MVTLSDDKIVILDNVEHSAAGVILPLLASVVVILVTKGWLAQLINISTDKYSTVLYCTITVLG